MPDLGADAELRGRGAAMTARLRALTAFLVFGTLAALSVRTHAAQQDEKPASACTCWTPVPVAIRMNPPADPGYR